MIKRRFKINFLLLIIIAMGMGSDFAFSQSVKVCSPEAKPLIKAQVYLYSQVLKGNRPATLRARNERRDFFVVPAAAKDSGLAKNVTAIIDDKSTTFAGTHDELLRKKALKILTNPGGAVVYPALTSNDCFWLSSGFDNLFLSSISKLDQLITKGIIATPAPNRDWIDQQGGFDGRGLSVEAIR